MSNRAPGRHRAPGRLNPATTLSAAVVRNTTPAAKVSAVLAVSGGMVASFGLPANATPVTTPPAAARTSTATVESVALAAPSVGVAVAAPAFGKIGFSGVVKKKPKLPRVDLLSRAADRVAAPRAAAPSAPRATTSRQTSHRASRSASRASISTSRSVAPASSGVLGIAASLVGIYYIYGGSTPAGFDCSGFTSYVFRKVGISLPRTAAAQQASATRVSSPQPGDLVFFGSPAYHVGIYAGGGMMYDSPHTGAKTSLRAVYSSSATYGRP